MCGFVVTNSDKDIKEMLYRQKHRGPDAQQFWSDGNVSMGHALLDISGETQLQPYKTKRGNVLVFNGETLMIPYSLRMELTRMVQNL